MLQVKTVAGGIEVVAQDSERQGLFQQRKKVSIFFADISVSGTDGIRDVRFVDTAAVPAVQRQSSIEDGWVTTVGVGDDNRSYVAEIRNEDLFNRLREAEVDAESRYCQFEKEATRSIESEGGVKERHMHRGRKVIPGAVLEALWILHEATGIPENELEKLYEEYYFSEYATGFLEKYKCPAIRHKYAIARTWIDARGKLPIPGPLDSSFSAFLDRCSYCSRAILDDRLINQMTQNIRSLVSEEIAAHREGYNCSSEVFMKRVRVYEQIQAVFRKGEISKEVHEALLEKARTRIRLPDK